MVSWFFHRLGRIGVRGTRCQSILSTSRTPREFKVVLDNDTLYVDQELAEALGWSPSQPQTQGVSLTLSGWAPNYFAIARTGSDSGEDATRIPVHVAHC